MKLELISFKLCPFVQRSVILLNLKGIEYSITYIDLANKPDWFLKISPLGKVPVLKVGNDVLFESAVIAEYLDETNPPSIHPTTPLERAKNRAWIEFSSELLMVQYRMMLATDKEIFDAEHNLLIERLTQLETYLNDGPYFNGNEFALVDAAFAPGWMRLNLLERTYKLGLFDRVPKVKRWSDVLLAMPSVKRSVVDDFEELFWRMLDERGSFLGK